MVNVTQLSDSLIIQLNIFKYIAAISKKVISNLNLYEEISLWRNKMLLSDIIYHGEEQSDCGHYPSGIKLDDLFFFSVKRVLKQQKLHCNSRSTNVPYILVYKKGNNFLIAPPNFLIGFAGVFPTSELITETAETLIWQ